MRKIARWRRSCKAVTEGELIHYAPDEGRGEYCYVYARIKDDDKVLVIMNGSTKSQIVRFDKYYDVLGESISGKDVITDSEVSLKDDLTIPGKGIFILEIHNK